MELYRNFIGIDIGKHSFTVAVHGKASTREYDNTEGGIASFLRAYRSRLIKGLSILEPTGGYELKLLLTLSDAGYAVHRAHTLQVKNFIRSFRNSVKTDSLDAKALANYGCERHKRLELFTPPTGQALELFQLEQRRLELKEMLVAEKNRRQAPRIKSLDKSFEAVIEVLEREAAAVVKRINAIIASDAQLREKKEILKSVPGIGDLIANNLLALVPELGKLNRRQIASLIGLAPQANDSGKYKGYRRTGFGRRTVKSILFMAAMSAARSKTELREYYQGLLARGKKKMVALVALMRKIIVIANARLRELDLKMAAVDQL